MTDLPSYGLVQRFMHDAGFPIPDPGNEMVFPEDKFMILASRLIQHGADQELEACCEWFANEGYGTAPARIRMHRRPKPPNLKEQALKALEPIERSASAPVTTNKESLALIRKALEALPND